MEKYGLGYYDLNATRAYYKVDYFKELKQAGSQKYSFIMRGNARGHHPPYLLLDKALLSELLEMGKSIWHISRTLKVSEFLIRRNIEYYGLLLKKDASLPQRLQRVDLDYLKKLDYLSPGLLEKAKTYYKDPLSYYQCIYKAYTSLMQLVFFVKKEAHGHGHWMDTHKIQKSSICWNMNRYEISLALALEDLGIEHIRQFCFYKRYMADFYLPKQRLLLEIDGEYHLKTKTKDMAKDKQALRLGYKILRFSTDDVQKDLNSIITKIQAQL
jgi:very-short-patch-repair endonuclease